MRKSLAVLLGYVILLGAAPSAARAQRGRDIKAVSIVEVKRSGPRYGAIWLSPQLIDSIRPKFRNQTINSTTSIFGWEFERELLENPHGAVPLTSFVLGVAGLDQGLVLPSLSWVVGMRTPNDFEVGIGPNVSPAGAALAVTAGMVFHSGELNIPFDVAYVSSRLGTRVSLTTGFNVMK